MAAYYLLCLAAVVVAWLKGGHTERLGAAVILAVFGFSFLLPPLRLWNVAVGEAALDIALGLFFFWLALRRERWWPLAMTAVMVLTILVHLAMFLVPDMGAYADVSARIGLGIAMALALLVGTAERWLAGEQAVSDSRGWGRRRPPGPPARPPLEEPAPFRPSL